MITRNEILMGREIQYPLTQELESNLNNLLVHLNQFRINYAIPMQVSSGYRPGSFNSSLSNAAKKSNHMICLACDFKDTDGKLAKFCLDNISILENCNLQAEDQTVLFLGIIPGKLSVLKYHLNHELKECFF